MCSPSAPSSSLACLCGPLTFLHSPSAQAPQCHCALQLYNGPTTHTQTHPPRRRQSAANTCRKHPDSARHKTGRFLQPSWPLPAHSSLSSPVGSAHIRQQLHRLVTQARLPLQLTQPHPQLHPPVAGVAVQGAGLRAGAEARGGDGGGGGGGRGRQDKGLSEAQDGLGTWGATGGAGAEGRGGGARRGQEGRKGVRGANALTGEVRGSGCMFLHKAHTFPLMSWVQ